MSKIDLQEITTCDTVKQERTYVLCAKEVSL